MTPYQQKQAERAQQRHNANLQRKQSRRRFSQVSAEDMLDRAYRSTYPMLAVTPSQSGGVIVGFSERGETEGAGLPFANWRDASGTLPGWARPNDPAQWQRVCECLDEMRQAA